jgi:hypothetical protein
MKNVQEQTRDFIVLFESLPEEVQMEIKKEIDNLLMPKPKKFDLSGLKTAAWNDEGKTYSRDELYEDDRV